MHALFGDWITISDMAVRALEPQLQNTQGRNHGDYATGDGRSLLGAEAWLVWVRMFGEGQRLAFERQGMVDDGVNTLKWKSLKYVTPLY